jgi:outer membrane protein assembly factor BamB
MIRYPEGATLKAFSKPRRWLGGAALLLMVVLTSCSGIVTGDSWAGISTDDQYVYVAYKNHVFRVNPGEANATNTRSVIRHIDWMAQASADTSNMYAPPTKSDGVLFVGSYDRKLYAFSVGGGLLPSWSSPTTSDKIVGSPTVTDNLVYVGMGDKGVRAYDRKTGTESWAYTDTAYGVWASPLVIGDILYFASLDHYLYVLNAQTGDFVSKLDLGGAVAGNLLPAPDRGLLYIGTLGNRVIAVSIAEPRALKIVSSYDTRGWVWGTPVLNSKGDTLYFADLAGYVYALDTSTFTLKWQATDTERPGGIRGRLALAPAPKRENQELVIAGSESKYLRAYDAQSGQPAWTSAISANDRVLSDLVVIGNDVIFATVSENQLVAAFDVNTGQVAWGVDYSAEVTRMQTATNIPLPTDTPKAPAAATATATSAQ